MKLWDGIPFERDADEATNKAARNFFWGVLVDGAACPKCKQPFERDMTKFATSAGLIAECAHCQHRVAFGFGK